MSDNIDCMDNSNNPDDLNKYKLNMLNNNVLKKTQTIYSSEKTTSREIDKYCTVQILNAESDTILFEYNQLTGSTQKLPHKFFTQNGDDWYLGSREYMSQLFVNLTTGEYYDNSIQDDMQDSGYDRKYGLFLKYNEEDVDDKLDDADDELDDENDEDEDRYSDEFIWTGIKISNDGNLAIVNGCWWGGPNEVHVYNISNIKNGWYNLNTDIGELDIGENTTLHNLLGECNVKVNGNNVIYRTKDTNLIECAFDKETNKLINLHLYDENLANETKKKQDKINERNENNLNKTKELFIGTDNIFKKWINNESIKYCEVINNNIDNSIKLLNVSPDDIVNISCHGKHSGSNYESHTRNFITSISTDNIVEELPDGAKYINGSMTNMETYYTSGIGIHNLKVQCSDGSLKNRLLSEQIGALTCSHWLDNPIAKSTVNNIGLIIKFECKDFCVEFCIDVFLSDYVDPKNPTAEPTHRVLQKDAKVLVTIS